MELQSGGGYTKEGKEYGNCKFVSVSSMPFDIQWCEECK